MRYLKYKYYRFLWWLTERFDYTPKTPLHVDIELTNQCNLACVMCSHGDKSWTPEKGMMPTETAKIIIDQCVTLGVFSVKLQFRGESMLHKDVVKIIKYAKDSGILEVQMNTNGIPFTDNKIVEMIEAGLDRLIVSVDGATNETYAAIRIGGDLNKVRHTLARFRHYKAQLQSKKPFIRLQMTQQEANKWEGQQLKREWKAFADEIIVKPVRSSNTGKRKSCPQPRQRIVFAWNGDVLGCCNAWNDESLLGRGVHIKGWWKSNEMKFLRAKAAKPNSAEPCRSCQVRASFK